VRKSREALGAPRARNAQVPCRDDGIPERCLGHIGMGSLQQDGLRNSPAHAYFDLTQVLAMDLVEVAMINDRPLSTKACDGNIEIYQAAFRSVPMSRK
jgi:hypothetical protein